MPTPMHSLNNIN